MKKIFLTLVAAAALTSASAQNSAVTNAILFQRNGTLDKARTEIDKAIINEKTSTKAKTWFTRGEIYDAMTSNPIYGKTLKPGEGTSVAYESYKKAIELDGKDGEFGKQAAAKLDNLYGLALNAGVESYNGKNYDEALKSYKMAQQIRPQDTTAYLYAAYAAEAKQDYASAKQTYGQLQGMNYKSAQMYGRMLEIARQEKNEAEYSKVLQSALAAYPNNKNFVLEDLNRLISAGQDKQAIDKLKHAIELDPTNSNLQTVLGSVYDKLKQPEQALAAYQKAVELDPKNFDAQYNAGVYYFNKGAEVSKALNGMSLATYQKVGKAKEAESKKYFQQSVPYFEAGLAVNPKDQATMKALQKAYTQLGRTADANRMNTQMSGAN
ncbi:tetratricopeptide repeat protein [Hymenobacter sp. BT186]|uniref:Tetratricopeptide repeat protein n=1 Tax=Hymenobacter telluris TaxID=2816474 RepID=A0A939JDN7_9BACT|nr:tetratricopeptide repeat protein [Hymenobacter telluris]MBO0358542.1 tetratricopeptide repeat protein [Hymenobacter telluris]MBW3374568.1 tetratricopeptide repeat protein [Hymenobacter norwichensis]